MDPIKFLKEVRVELKKVTWPTRSEVVRMSGIVVFVSLIVGLYIGVLDIAFAKILETVVK